MRRLAGKKVPPLFFIGLWIGTAFIVASSTIGAYVDSK